MPDGAVKRVQATGGDTVHALVAKLGMADDSAGLALDATGDVAAPTASVASLRLGNGDFLYVKVCLDWASKKSCSSNDEV